MIENTDLLIRARASCSSDGGQPPLGPRPEAPWPPSVGGVSPAWKLPLPGHLRRSAAGGHVTVSGREYAAANSPNGTLVARRSRPVYGAGVNGVPDHLRPAIAAQLDALVRGELPELLTWVHGYGERGAVLVPQPEEIWIYPESDAIPVDGGGWSVVVPLWTTDESPSDLSAEIDVDADGNAQIYDVHVL